MTQPEKWQQLLLIRWTKKENAIGLYCQPQATREDPPHSPLKPSRQVHT